MGEEVELFSSEEQTDRASVATFLHELADKVADGRVRFRRESQTIEVEIPTTVTFEVELEQEWEDGVVERSLEIEIEWREGGEE